MRGDRLASVRSGGPGNLGYQAQYPYGVEYTATTNDREKYATYTRDSVSGLDYAANRYYWSQWGRFLSPDPEASYEEFLAGGGLKLVVQYQKRSRGDSVSYEGSPVVLTFDTVTIAGDAATLNPATMVATVEHASRLDLDGKVSQSIIPKSPRVELDINRRTIRIDSGTGSETLRF
jgi:RHS repeat-associated protein